MLCFQGYVWALLADTQDSTGSAERSAEKMCRTLHISRFSFASGERFPVVAG